MKKVLVGYISEGKADGINSYIRNFCNSLSDKDVQIDFLTRDDNLTLESLEIKGNNIYKVSRNRNPIKQFKEMKNIVSQNEYDVAYFNVSESFNCIGIIAAKLFNVKKVVVHSHSSGVEKSSKMKTIVFKMVNAICKSVMVACADVKLACSKKAAEWLYTKDIVNKRKYDIIFNAVDYNKFQFDKDVRDDIRKKYELENKFVVGHVGRFCYPKNHGYLMDIFKEIAEKKDNAVLVCAGDGPDYDNVREYAKEIGLSDNVVFLGAINNVHELVQSFDIFLLPSRFEGLPIVAVEAQFSGVPCLFSANIDDNVVIGENTKLIPVGQEDVDKWVVNTLECTERKNILTESSQNYMLEKQGQQFLKIVKDEGCMEKNTMPLDIIVKVLLCIHYFFNITCLYNGFTFLLPFAFIAMLGIVFFAVKRLKIISKDKMFRLLVMMLVGYGLTFLLSHNYDMIGSVKIAIWMCINFCFIFGYNHFKKEEQVVFEIDLIMKIYIAICSLLNLHNLYLLIGNVSTVVKSLNGQPLLFGVAPWGRFFGNHYDPNYASICFGCAIIMACYLLKKQDNMYNKILYGISIFLQAVYIIFAQSRTARVSILIGLVVYVFLSVARSKKKMLAIKNFAASIIIIAIVAIVPDTTISLYNNITATADSNRLDEDSDLNEDDNNDSENEVIVIGRDDINSSDVSNRRFDIWLSGLEIASHNVFYGIGFANIKPYALDKCPDTYIVNNDYKQFDAFHNMFVDVLVSQGVIGIGIVLAICIYFAYSIITSLKKLFIDSPNADAIIMLTSCVCVLLSASMFLSMIFYINNICSFVFWLVLGYLYYFIKKKDIKKV